MMTTFADSADLPARHGLRVGQLNCGCHPDCGVGMAVMIDKETKERRGVSFLDGWQLVKDLAVVNDAARGSGCRSSAWPWRSCGTSTRFKTRHAPADRGVKKFDKASAPPGALRLRRKRPDARRSCEERRQMMFYSSSRAFVPGPLDLRTSGARTSAAFPTARRTARSRLRLQHRRGWRADVEKRHQNRTLAQWYSKEGRHQIYTGGHPVSLPTTETRWW